MVRKFGLCPPPSDSSWVCGVRKQAEWCVICEDVKHSHEPAGHISKKREMSNRISTLFKVVAFASRSLYPLRFVRYVLSLWSSPTLVINIIINRRIPSTANLSSAATAVMVMRRMGGGGGREIVHVRIR
jgi:hypothetical protein